MKGIIRFILHALMTLLVWQIVCIFLIDMPFKIFLFMEILAGLSSIFTNFVSTKLGLFPTKT